MSKVLNKENLFKIAPSIFTTQAHVETSNKYQQISTLSIVNALEQEGFYPVWAGQSASRNHENTPFAKHMLRFRHHTSFNDTGLYPELVLVNSHDGMSSYRINAGLFRLVCSNGMIAGTTYNEVRVKHQGNIINNVIDGTFRIAKDANLMLESAKEMSMILLTQEEKFFLAEAAHSLRFDAESPLSTAISARSFLIPKRSIDHTNHDLFTTFNVIQENIIKGGVRGIDRTNGIIRRVTTRQVNSIDQNIKLNKALWTLAEKMMQLKIA